MINTLDGELKNQIGYQSFNDRWDPTLIQLRTIFETMTEMLVEWKWYKWNAATVFSYSWPVWVWKSMLMNIMQNSLRVAWVQFKVGERWMFSSFPDMKKQEGVQPIVFMDDFLLESQSFQNLLEQVDTRRIFDQTPAGLSGSIREFRELPDFIYTLYEQKWLFIVNSNFPMNTVLEASAERYDRGEHKRIADRIRQLTSGGVGCFTINPELSSYRQILATEPNSFLGSLMTGTTWSLRKLIP